MVRLVPSFEDYTVDEQGNVVSHKSKLPRVLKQRVCGGYVTYILSTDTGKYGISRAAVKAHRLVAELFLSNPHGYKEVNHIDGNKLNNSVNNLEWCSRADNMRHAVRCGLHDMVSKSGVTYSVLSPEKVKVTFTGLNKFCRDNNLFPSPLKEVIDGKRKQHKGWTACQS